MYYAIAIMYFVGFVFIGYEIWKSSRMPVID